MKKNEVGCFTYKPWENKMIKVKECGILELYTTIKVTQAVPIGGF